MAERRSNAAEQPDTAVDLDSVPRPAFASAPPYPRSTLTAGRADGS
jgi:hypothetical protein